MSLSIKEIKSKIIEDWKQNYVDYIKLDSIVSKFKKSRADSNNSNNVDMNNSIQVETTKVPNAEKNHNKSIATEGSALSNTEFARIEEVIKFFEEEIKKVYLFYAQVEREIYLQINNRINSKGQYSGFGLREIQNEIVRLKNISSLTYSIVKFVNLNLFIITEALSCYRETFGQVESETIQMFFQSQLDQINSDLSYMIAFKIVDEVSVIIDSFIQIFEDIMKLPSNLPVSSKFHKKLSLNNKKADDESNKKTEEETIPNDYSPNTNNKEIKQTLLEVKNSFGDAQTQNDIISKIHSDISYIKLTIECMDVISMEHRSESSDNNNFISLNNKIVVNQVSNIGETARRSFVFIGYDDVPNKNLLRESFILKNQSKFITKQAKVNIFAILVHTFLHMMITTLPISTFAVYFFFNDYLVHEACFVMAVTPICSSISSYLGFRTYKLSLKSTIILSIVFMFASCILYGIFEDVNNIILPIISRILAGLSSIRSVNRKYIIDNTPSGISQKISLYFQLCSHFGSIFGFFLSFVLAFIIQDTYFIGNMTLSAYSTPMYIAAIFIFMFLVFVIVAFNSDSGYHMKKQDDSLEEIDETENEENEEEKEFENKIEYPDHIGNKIKNSRTTRKGKVRKIREDLSQKKIFSKEEQKMVREINNKLCEANEKAKFTTTNFLQKELNYICEKEGKFKGYIFYSYIVLTLSVINSKASSDFMILYSSVYLIQNTMDNMQLWIICCAIFLAMLLVTPVYLLALNTYNIKLLYISKTFLLMLSIPYLFYQHSIYVFCTLAFIVFLSFYSELFASKLFMQIVPYDYKIFGMDSGETLSYLNGFAKSFTIVLFGLAFVFYDTMDSITLFIYIIMCARLIFSLGLLFWFKKYLRVKALSRVMNMKKTQSL